MSRGSPRAAIEVLRRRWRLVLVTAIVCAGSAALVSSARPDVYEAEAEILFRAPAYGVPGEESGGGDPARVRANVQELLSSPQVEDRVRRRLGAGSGPLHDEELEVEAVKDSDVLVLRVRDRDPEHAAAVANSYASETAGYFQQLARERLRRPARAARARLEALSPLQRASSAGRRLERRTEELETAAGLQTGELEVVGIAAVPRVPVEPKPLRSGLIALGLGLLIGLGIAYAGSIVDRRLHDEDDMEREFGAPVLVTLPRGPRGGLRQPVTEAERAGLGVLAAFLRLGGGGPARTVVVTGAGPAPGADRVVVGLAAALAEQGLRAVVVEGDLHRPRMDRALGLGDRAGGGLTAVVSGTEAVSDAVVAIDSTTLRPPDGGEAGAVFGVLPAGSPLLVRRHLAVVLSVGVGLVGEADVADVVLVAAPPLGEATDLVALLELADDLVVVAAHGRVTRDDARRTRRLLALVGAAPRGVVVTGAPTAQRGLAATEVYAGSA